MKNKKIFLLSLLGIFLFPFFNLPAQIVTLNKADFLQKVHNYEKNPEKWSYQGKLPCIIIFSADWNKTNKELVKNLEDIATEHKGKLMVYNVNTDAEREVAKAFKIVVIPTLMFVSLSGDPDISKGNISKDQIQKAIARIL